MAAPAARGPTGRGEDPAASSPEPAWEPVVTRPDPMTEEEQNALLDAATLPDCQAAKASNAAAR